MIYTVTLNPAIDHIVETECFRTGALNRAREEYFFPGGKGVNASLVLTRLGVDNMAFGFLAGATGRAYQAMLADFSQAEAFLFLEQGFTRINTKVNCQEKQKETEINGIGPSLSWKELDRLCERLSGVGPGDVIVLSGSVPEGISGAYAYLLDQLAGSGMQAAVDTSGEELWKTLSHRPFLIKPNLQELEELIQASIQTEEELKAAVLTLQKEGARNVLVSMGAKGACLFTEEEAAYYAPGLAGQVGNTVGAGDSMVAGFLAGCQKGGSVEESFRMAVAAGSATAFAFGIAGKEEILRQRERIAIVPFPFGEGREEA